MKFQHILLFAATCALALAQTSQTDSVPVPDSTDIQPANAQTQSAAPEQVDAGEESVQDDTDAAENPSVDDTPAPVPTDSEVQGQAEAAETKADADEENAGEISDDYEKAGDVAAAETNGQESEVDLPAPGANIDELDAKDAEDKAGAEKEEDKKDTDKEEKKDHDNLAAKVATSLGGAAALTGAGVFLWVKKSKKNTRLQSINSQLV